MAVKSGVPPLETLPKQGSSSPSEEGRYIFYTGTNRLRADETFDSHGIVMRKGVVYRVSERVYEFLKARKGFETVIGLDTINLIDFKRENATKTTMGQ